MKNITVKELNDMIEKKEDMILLDVRTSAEYNEGHLKDSILIPYDDLDIRHKEMNVDKNSLIVVYCRTGHRSVIGGKTLERLGYSNVINVLGGFDEWAMCGYEFL